MLFLSLRPTLFLVQYGNLTPCGSTLWVVRLVHRRYVEGYYKSSWRDDTARRHGRLVETTLLSWKYLMERTYYTLSLDLEMALWRQWPYLGILFVWEFCHEMFRYCEDNTYIIVIVNYGSYTWSYIVHFIVPKMTLVISMRTTFWEDFGLHCGLSITVVERLQRYDLHWQCRTENSILHWDWKLWDAISMWKTDLEKELCVLSMFCTQKKVVQIPCVNHFVLEKLVSLWPLSWLFTFGWEPVWFENFWKCFDDFEFI